MLLNPRGFKLNSEGKSTYEQLARTQITMRRFVYGICASTVQAESARIELFANATGDSEGLVSLVTLNLKY